MATLEAKFVEITRDLRDPRDIVKPEHSSKLEEYFQAFQESSLHLNIPQPRETFRKRLEFIAKYRQNPWQLSSLPDLGEPFRLRSKTTLRSYRLVPNPRPLHALLLAEDPPPGFRPPHIYDVVGTDEKGTPLSHGIVIEEAHDSGILLDATFNTRRPNLPVNESLAISQEISDVHAALAQKILYTFQKLHPSKSLLVKNGDLLLTFECQAAPRDPKNKWTVIKPGSNRAALEKVLQSRKSRLMIDILEATPPDEFDTSPLVENLRSILLTEGDSSASRTAVFDVLEFGTGKKILQDVLPQLAKSPSEAIRHLAQNYYAKQPTLFFALPPDQSQELMSALLNRLTHEKKWQDEFLLRSIERLARTYKGPPWKLQPTYASLLDLAHNHAQLELALDRLEPFLSSPAFDTVGLGPIFQELWNLTTFPAVSDKRLHRFFRKAMSKLPREQLHFEFEVSETDRCASKLSRAVAAALRLLKRN